jgi:hypothetical protein
MSQFTTAAQAGVSSIPVNTQTKAPMVPSWTQYQDHIADLDELTQWDRRFSAGRCGIAVICGRVSDRLLAIDIEGSFAQRLGELAEALRKAGLFELFERWVDGYCEETPRGGLHVLVRIGGDDPVPHNDKLAFDGAGNVLIETRGEGGYIIIAPSRNGSRAWRLTHGGLGSIAWATAQEWAAVAAVLAGFDESPQQPTSPPIAAALPSILRLSESWIDEVKASLPDYRSVLEADGWVFGRSDGFGTHCTRPGKDPRLGSSANLSNDGYLWIHSTSTPFPTGVGIDEVAYLFARDNGGRLPDVSERTEALRAHRPQATAGGAAGQAADASPATGGPTADVDPTADISVRLDNEFWQSTEWLAAIRAAAWARGLAPSGALGAWLATYGATLPSGIRIPAVGPASAPLNLFCCLVGQSGTGKTATMRLARDLVGPVTNPDIVLGRSLRSGEGLIRLARKPQPKTAPGGVAVDPSYRTGLLLSIDEAATLGKQAERSGSTMISNLNSVWAGGTNVVGGAKADEDDFFPADLVRVCAVLSVQYGIAGNLFTGEAKRSGFPQRLLFFGLRDPQILELDRSTRTSAPIPPLDVATYHASDFTRHPLEIDVPTYICDEVRAWLDNNLHGSGLADDYDAHLYNNQLRVAAICALAGGKTGIGELEWELSRQIIDVSRRIRSSLVSALGDLAKERARALGRDDVVREEVREDAWLAKRARRITAFVKKRGGASMKEIKSDALDSSERLRRNEIVAYAVARGWLAVDDGRVIHRGEE